MESDCMKLNSTRLYYNQLGGDPPWIIQIKPKTIPTRHLYSSVSQIDSILNAIQVIPKVTCSEDTPRTLQLRGLHILHLLKLYNLLRTLPTIILSSVLITLTSTFLAYAINYRWRELRKLYRKWLNCLLNILSNLLSI